MTHPVKLGREMAAYLHPSRRYSVGVDARPPFHGTALWVTVGPPGGGKSALVTEQLAGVGEVISSDRVREEMTGSRADQSRNADVFRTVWDTVAPALARGQSMVVDATMCDAASLGGAAEVASRVGVPLIAAIAAPDLGTCLERNREREHAVPDSVVCRMHLGFCVLAPTLLRVADLVWAPRPPGRAGGRALAKGQAHHQVMFHGRALAMLIRDIDLIAPVPSWAQGDMWVDPVSSELWATDARLYAELAQSLARIAGNEDDRRGAALAILHTLHDVGVAEVSPRLLNGPPLGMHHALHPRFMSRA